MDINITIPKYNVKKEIISLNYNHYPIDTNLETILLKKLSDQISDGIFYSSKEISKFIVVYLSYWLYKHNIDFNLTHSANFNYLFFNSSFDSLYNLINRLPEKYDQNTIDKYCDIMLADCYNIKYFIYMMFNNEEYFIFSDKIADKYDYLINANKFDLI